QFTPNIFLLPGSHHPLTLHAFPTRRSSDLFAGFDLLDNFLYERSCQRIALEVCVDVASLYILKTSGACVEGDQDYVAVYAVGNRSEEHTSELQSRFDLVCRLLLEKKNMERW